MAKTCPECHARNPEAASECWGCSYRFPQRSYPSLHHSKDLPSHGPYDPYQLQEAERYDTYGMICGFVGLVAGFFLGPLAIYFGKKAKDLDPSKGTMAIVLGILDIVVAVVFLYLILAVFSYFGL